MACIVESVVLENGEVSELFQELSNNMSPAAALETYLELTNNKGYAKIYGTNKQGEINAANYLQTPKFKLAEFETYRQQLDVMDYLVDIIVNDLSKNTMHKGKTTLAPINLEGLSNNPLVVRGIITQTRNRLNDIKAKNLGSTDKMRLVDMAIKELPRYLGEAGSLGPLGLRLKDYGINLNVKNSFVEAETYDETSFEERVDEEGQVDGESEGGRGTERLYNMSIIDVNPATTILAPLKLFIKRLPRVHKDFVVDPSNPYAEPTYEHGEMGTPRPVNYGLVYGKLQSILRGVQTVEQMEQTILESLTSAPELVPLYRELLAEKESPVTGIKGVGAYHKLSTALMSLAKADNNMVSFVDYGKGDVRVNYANSTTVQSKVKGQWALDIQYIKDIPLTERNKRKQTITDFIDSKSNMKMLDAVKKDPNTNVEVPNPSGIVLNQAADLFVANGFLDVTKEDLKVAIADVKSNPYLLNSSGAETATSGIIKALLRTLPQRVLDNKDVFNTSADGEFAENKTLGILSNAVAKRKTDIFAGSFLSGRGSVVSPINLSTEAHDIVNRLKMDAELVGQFLNDPMYADSLIFNILNDNSAARGMLEVQTIDVFKSNAINKGTTYGKLSSFDALALKMNAFFAPRQNSKFFHAFSPTLGDRGNMTMMVLPKINVDQTNEAYTQPVRNAKGEITSDEITKWIYNQVKAEVTRIAASKNIDDYKNYSLKKGDELVGNAGKFNLFPALNSIDIGDVQNNVHSIATAMAKVLPQAKIEFTKMLDSDSQYMVDKGLLAKDGTEFKTTMTAQKVLNKSIGKTDTKNKYSMTKVIPKKDIDTFLANNFIYGYEQTLLYMGDMAFYKASSPSLQMVDMNKRFALPHTPGVKTPVGENTGMPSKSKVVILKEGTQDAEFFDVYNAVLGAKRSTKPSGERTYKGIELADGIGWVSLSRYRNMMVSRGMHSDEMLDLLSKLEDWKPGQKDVISKADLGAIKNFYFKIMQTPEGIMAPFNMKYALYPVIPAFFEQTIDGVEKYPTMAKISRALKDGTADEIVMESAVKVGNRGSVTPTDLGKARAITIDNDAVRIPQVTPTETKLSDRAGSQFRKQSIGNFEGSGPMVMRDSEQDFEMDSADALAGYNKAINQIVTEAGESVTREFLDEDGTAREDKLIKSLLNDVDNNPHNNAEFYREALSTVFKEDPLLSLNHPSIAGRLDNLINASYRRKVNRFKLPGHSAVQIPSYGMAAKKSDGTLSVKSDLKFIRFRTKGGAELSQADALLLAKKIQDNKAEDQDFINNHEVVPAEIRVTPKFFLGRLKQIAADNVKKDLGPIRAKAKQYVKKFEGNELEQQERYKTYMSSAINTANNSEYRRLKATVTDAQGNIKLDKLKNAGLDRIVLYRIPTQLKNSAFPAVIKEFLPPYSGNTVQVPAELVEQAGSDFDIDKVYMEMKDFNLMDDGSLKGVSFTKDGELDLSTKSKAQAFIQEFHMSVLTSTSHVAELLLPNTTATLSKIANDVYGKGDNSLVSSWASLETQEYFRDANKAGKELIAISSISSVMHIMAPHIGAKFSNQVVIGGKPLTLGMENNYILQEELKAKRVNKNSYGDKIAYEIFQIQNAALDNARDPLLGKLNISNFTASAALLLVSAGHGLKFATDLLNTPVIKSLSDRYSIYSRTQSENQALDSAIADVKSLYGLPLGAPPKQVYSLDTFTANTAEALVENQNPTKEDLSISLQAFLDIKELGDQLSLFQRTMNFDSKGTPSSVVKLIDNEAVLAGIPGTLAHKAYQTDKKGSILGEYAIKPDTSPIEVDATKYRASHLAAMEKYSIHEPLVTNFRVSPNASLQFQRVLEVAKDTLGYLTEGQQLQLMADYNTYLTVNGSSNKIAATSVSTQTESGDFLALSDPDTGVGAQVLAYRKSIANDPDATVNTFVENLTVIERDGRKFVTFNNTVSATLTGELKEEMMFHFEDLMYSKNPRERRLARLLADYAVTYYGFRKGINSYMDLLPPQAHVQYMGTSKGVNALSVPDYFRKIAPELNYKESFTPPDVFVRDFIRNNYNSLAAVEFVDLNDPNWEYEMLMEENPPKFVKGYVNGSLRLRELTMGGYTPLKPKGIPNLAVEYHSHDKSYFNGSSAPIDMAADAKLATGDNAKAVEAIDSFDSYKDLFQSIGNYNTMTFTPTSLKNYIGDVINYIEENSTFTKTDMQDLTRGVESAAINSANTRFRIGKRHDPTLTFTDAARTSINSSIQLLDSNAGRPIEQIKNCNA